MESKSPYLSHSKFCPVSLALWGLFWFFFKMKKRFNKRFHIKFMPSFHSMKGMKGSIWKYISPTKDYFLEFTQIWNLYLFSQNNVFQQELHTFAVRRKSQTNDVSLTWKQLGTMMVGFLGLLQTTNKNNYWYRH